MNTWDSLSKQVVDKETGVVKSTDNRPIRDTYAQAMMAPQYADLTWPVAKGQHCIYEGHLYVAAQDIATSEAWTAAHWTEVKLGAELADLKSEIADIIEDEFTLTMAAQNGYIHSSSGFFTTSANWRATDYLAVDQYDKFRYTRATSTMDASSPYAVVLGIAFFEAVDYQTYISGQLISYSASANTYEDSIVDVPANAKYVRFSFWADTTRGDISVKGIRKISNLYNDLSDRIDLTQKNIIPVWKQGAISTADGSEYYLGKRLISKNIYVKGKLLTIHRTATDAFKFMIAQYDANGDFISMVSSTVWESMVDGLQEAFPDNVDSIRLMVTTQDDIATITPSDVADVYITDVLSDNINCPVVDTIAELKLTKYPVGTYIRTVGFNRVGDYGEGLYQIKSSSEDLAVNNCSIFTDANNNFIVRIFDKPYLYLESLDVENLPWATVNAVVEATGLNDVRANRLNMDHVIEISNYDFNFVRITSTTTPALILSDMDGRKVIGKYIDATGMDGAIGLMITNRNGHFQRNMVDIRAISATGICVYIRPYNGKGILNNDYYFGYLRGVKYSGGTGPSYGIRLHVRSVKENDEYVLDANGLPLYSFEGEDQFHVNRITVSNIRTSTDETTGETITTGGTAAALGIETEVYYGEPFTAGKIDDNTSVFGTITGMTFHNLSVEGSDVGVYMRCGERSPYASSRYDSGVKSIVINNMRVREMLTSFFDFLGYFRDIYIKPTSKIALKYIGWRSARTGERHSGIAYDAENDSYDFPILNRGTQAIIIDAPVYNGFVSGMSSYGRDDGIGNKLIAMNSRVYIGERIPDIMYVTADTETYKNTHNLGIVEGSEGDYTLRRFYENYYLCVDRFKIMDDLSGTVETPSSVTLDLREYYAQESAVGIHVSVPAYCEVFIRIETLGTVKICNSNTGRKEYTFSRYNRRPSASVADYVIVEDQIVIPV